MNPRATLTALCLGLALYGAAQTRMPASTQLAISQLASVAKQEPAARKLVDLTRARFPTVYMNGTCMVGFLGKLKSGAQLTEEQGIQWGARVGDIISFRVDARRLDRLHTLQGLSYAQLACARKRMLDKEVRSVRADSVQQGINLPQTFTGRNVILGIVDIGFDYTHPMFYDTAMTATRILAAWDQYKLSGPAPAGYTYGTVHEGAAALLAAQCDTIDPWGFRDTHGTHVAGIAGGGGAGTPYRGVAFDAEYLFASLGDDAAILDAFAWMRDRAQHENKRLVINCSWGARMGPLDGTDLLDQAMDQMSDQGVLFACANGNYGDVACHIKHAFVGDTLRTRAAFSGNTWEYYAGQSLLLWGEAGSPFSASIAYTNTANTVLGATPWYTTASGPAFVDSILVSGNDTLYFTVAYEATHPLNGRPFMRFTARRTGPLVKLALRITAPSGTVHAWNDESFTGGVALGGTEFQAPQVGWTAGDHQYTVVDPACAQSVIGAGVYIAEHDGTGGSLAGFSSRGPTVDERMKPDLAAPGIDVVSAINRFTNVSYDEVTTVSFNGNDHPFGLMSGTSMAAPMASGCAALLLEAAPTATPAQIKSALLDNTRTDGFTGVIPPQGSMAWGRGKLNVYRAVVDLLGVAGVAESSTDELLVWPNPVTGLLNAHRCQDGLAQITLIDAAGRIMHRASATGEMVTIDMRDHPAGAYVLVIKDAGGASIRSIVRE